MINRGALHSAARRYCMERLDELIAMQGYRDPRSGDQAQLEAWERAIPLPGILHAIEMKVADEFTDVESVRAFLLDVCAYTQWPTGRDVRDLPGSQGENDTRLAERERFRAAVMALTEAAVQQTPRVPFRRVLRSEERRKILRRVARAWPSGEDNWHPLTAVLKTSDHHALQSVRVGTEDLPLEPMRRVLAGLASGRHIWQLNEGGPHGWTEDIRSYIGSGDARVSLVPLPMWTGFELDAALWWAPDLGSETLWTSSRFDWLLYAHHEGALYVAGAALVHRLKLVWPGWEARLWTGLDYDRPDLRSN
jgi:hypothetical protein